MSKDNYPANPGDEGLYGFDWNLEPESADWWKPGYKEKEEQYNKWDNLPPSSKKCRGIRYDDFGREIPFSICCGIEFFDADGESGRWSDHIYWHIRHGWRCLPRDERSSWVKFCREKMQDLIKPYNLYAEAYWNAIIDFRLDPPIKLRTVKHAISREFIKPKDILREQIEEKKEKEIIKDMWRSLAPREKALWKEFDKRIFIETEPGLTKADKKEILRCGTGYSAPGYYLFELFWEDRRRQTFSRRKREEKRKMQFRTPYQVYKLGLLKRYFPESVTWSHAFWNWLLES